METDVQNYSGGAQALGVQHAHVVGGVVVVAELGHEAFGIQRPSFTVTGVPGEIASPVVEGIFDVSSHAEL